MSENCMNILRTYMSVMVLVLDSVGLHVVSLKDKKSIV